MTAEEVGHSVGAVLFAFLISLPTALVVMVTLGSLHLDHPHLHVPALSFWQTYGVMLGLRSIAAAAASPHRYDRKRKEWVR